MNLQELIKRYLDDDTKVNEFLEEMKANKIYTASEENLDTRYSKLKGEFDIKSKEHEEANKLIAELKKSNQGNEELQKSISTHEARIAELEAENNQLKLDNAIKVELLNAKAKGDDLDYLMFKIKQNNEKLSLTENGELKGFDVEEIKTAYPSNFEVETKKVVDVNNLPKIDTSDNTITKEQFDKMGYKERTKLFNDNPEVYNELKNK